MVPLLIFGAGTSTAQLGCQHPVDAGNCVPTDLNPVVMQGQSQDACTPYRCTLGHQKIVTKVLDLAGLADECRHAAIAAAADGVFVNTMCRSKRSNFNTTLRAFILLAKDHDARMLAFPVLRLHALKVWRRVEDRLSAG